MTLGQQELGRRIRQAREDAGLTQSELADRIGLSHPQSISRYERGETEVPQKRLRRIADETGKQLNHFLADEVDSAPAVSAEDVELLAMVKEIRAEIRDLRADVRRLEGPPTQAGTPRARGASS